MESDGKTYCFGDYRFIPDRQLLMLGGNPVRVGSRALDLLHKLISHSGQVVGKNELMSFAWPDTFVHESNLKVNIAALRRALSRDASGLSYIATVTGRGYRFVAPVRTYGGDRKQHSFDPVKAFTRELPRLPHVVGRDDIVAELGARLPKSRLLTVVGQAGVGKTTVAVAVAKSLRDHYREGVCFVDLAVIGDPQLVDVTIAAALGIGGKWSNTLAGIVEALRGHEILLVLDNCEHVLSTASAIAEHLTLALPGLHIIATSREPLRSRSESVYRLSPLSYPDEHSGKDRTAALMFPAVQLFVQCANEAGYELDDASAPVVAAICRRLDGIALAIELAASQLPVLKPTTLLILLEHSFEPLVASSVGTPPRHQTLLATLDWSYRLLSKDEAQLLRLLSVFSASFSFSDVIGVAGGLGRSIEDIVTCTESLAAKSLLSAAHDTEGLRYRLLDSTRSFAAERLDRSGEAAQVRSSHARYLLRLFEQAEAEWLWRPRNDWTARYAQRANDLREAINWALGDGAQPEVGVRLTAAAIPLWDELSTVAESRRCVERALQCADALSRCDAAVNMKLIASYASGLNFSDHFGPEADAAWTQANGLARVIGNVDYQLRTLWGYGILQTFTGRHRQAIATLEEFAQLAGREDERQAVAEGERVRLTALFYRGDVRRAHNDLKRLAYDHATTAKRSGVARFQVDRFVSIRVALAMTAWVAGDRGEATVALKDALDHSLVLEHAVSHSNALAQAALPIALWSGEARIARLHVEALARNLALREIPIWNPVCRFYDGAVASMDGDPEGVDTMHLAIEQLIANNFLVRVPFYLTMLAEAALRGGRTALARDSLSAAFDRADRQSEQWSRPELLRVRGMLLQRLDGDLPGASETLQLAIETARESGALFFRLRASTALAELWAEADRHAAAAELLSPVCAQFDDQVPCVSVMKARQLLEALRQNPGGTKASDIQIESFGILADRIS